MIPREKLRWTEQDTKDAIKFVKGVEDGSIETVDFFSLKRD